MMIKEGSTIPVNYMIPMTGFLDWIIDWKYFYAVSEIFLPYNAEAVYLVVGHSHKNYIVQMHFFLISTIHEYSNK